MPSKVLFVGKKSDDRGRSVIARQNNYSPQCRWLMVASHLYFGK